MSFDRGKLAAWAGRGKRTASATTSQAPAAPTQPSLPPPPPGYGYVFQGGVPVLVQLQPLQATPGQAFLPPPLPPLPPGAYAAPGRTVTRQARLVRPLTKDGVVVPDPYDTMMAGLPDLAPNAQTNHLFEALADEGDLTGAVQSGGVSAPDDPFGRGGRARLRLVASDLKTEG